MDKNKNKVPDWVENVIYWGSISLVLGQTLKKIMSGEDLTKSFDVTYSGGDNAISNSTK